MEEQKLHEQNLDAQKRTHKTKNRTPGGSPRAREEHKKFNYLSQLRWQEGENLRSQAKAPEPSEDTNHPDVGLDGAEGKSIKTRTSGGPGARENPWGSWSVPEAPWAPPSLLGCSRLPQDGGNLSGPNREKLRDFNARPGGSRGWPRNLKTLPPSDGREPSVLG